MKLIKEVVEDNTLEKAAKEAKKKQKGQGYFVNYNAGDVEHNTEFFNNATNADCGGECMAEELSPEEEVKLRELEYERQELEDEIDRNDNNPYFDATDIHKRMEQIDKETAELEEKAKEWKYVISTGTNDWKAQESSVIVGEAQDAINHLNILLAEDDSIFNFNIEYCGVNENPLSADTNIDTLVDGTYEAPEADKYANRKDYSGTWKLNDANNFEMHGDKLVMKINENIIKEDTKQDDIDINLIDALNELDAYEYHDFVNMYYDADLNDEDKLRLAVMLSGVNEDDVQSVYNFLSCRLKGVDDCDFYSKEKKHKLFDLEDDEFYQSEDAFDELNKLNDIEEV